MRRDDAPGARLPRGPGSPGIRRGSRGTVGRMTNLVAQLAENVKNAGVGTVYGDPLDIDGSTIVPVAFAWYGFGGGSDLPDSEGNVAGGGGGGGATWPIGAYIATDGEVRFQPNVIALLAVATPVIWISGKVLVKLIKTLR